MSEQSTRSPETDNWGKSLVLDAIRRASSEAERLDNVKIELILTAAKAGIPQKEIAEASKLSQGRVSQIIKEN